MPVPSGGCKNATFLLISQVNRFICRQSWFLMYPSEADCWMHVGEEPGNDFFIVNFCFQNVVLRSECCSCSEPILSFYPLTLSSTQHYCNAHLLTLTCHRKPLGPVAAVHHRVVPHPEEVLATLLSTQPVQSTLPQQVHGLKHSLDSGGSFRLSQDASSIFTETFGKRPWFLLVECLKA